MGSHEYAVPVGMRLFARNESVSLRWYQGSSPITVGKTEYADHLNRIENRTSCSNIHATPSRLRLIIRVSVMIKKESAAARMKKGHALPTDSGVAQLSNTANVNKA